MPEIKQFSRQDQLQHGNERRNCDPVIKSEGRTRKGLERGTDSETCGVTAKWGWGRVLAGGCGEVGGTDSYEEHVGTLGAGTTLFLDHGTHRETACAFKTNSKFSSI